MKEDINSALQEIIYNIFLEKIDIEKDISFEDSFKSDIFDILELIDAVEKRFGIEIPDGDLVYFKTTAGVSDYIARRVAELEKWISEKD